MITLAAKSKSPFIARTFVHAGGALLASLVLFGCAIGKDGSTTSGACGGQDMSAQASAFGSTLQPSIIKASCNNCHDGSGKAPFSFAASDPSAGVGSALQVVDLTNPPNSRIISKVGNEMHNCGTNCASIASDFKTQIQAWAAQVANIPVPTCTAPTVTSDAITIRASDLNTTKDTVYHWDMKGPQNGLGTVWFQMRARLYQPDPNIPPLYILSAPVVATAQKRLKVGAIQFVINGELDTSYANFVGVNYVVDAKDFTPTDANYVFPNVSTSNQMIAWVNSEDSVAVQIGMYPTSDAPSAPLDNPYMCNEVDLFMNTVYAPILNASVGGNVCTNCHGGTNTSATNAYSLIAGSDVCSATLRKVNFTTPAGSLLLAKPTGVTSHSGGSQLAGRTAQINAIINWINAEASHH